MIQLITGFFKKPCQFEHQHTPIPDDSSLAVSLRFFQSCSNLLCAHQVQQLYDELFSSYYSSSHFHCSCGHKWYCHGTVPRKIILPSGTFTIRIHRVRCPACRKVHRVLCDLFVPFHSLCMKDANAIVQAVEHGKSACQADVSESLDASAIYRFGRRCQDILKPYKKHRPFYFLFQFVNQITNILDGFIFQNTRVFQPASPLDRRQKLRL